ncbi:MAG: PAS domain S-box protein [Bacteroidota bacterium]
MKDESITKKELIAELRILRRKLKRLEKISPPNQTNKPANHKNHYLILESIIGSTNEPVFSVDKNYCYTSFNKSHAKIMKSIYGTNIEIGKTILEYMTVKKDRNIAKQNLKIALSGKQIVKEAYSGDELKSRRYFRVSHSPIKNSKGNVIGAAVIAQDITDHKKSEEYLFKEAERGKLLLQLYEKSFRLMDKDLYDFALDIAVNITESKIGFLHLVSDDQKNIILTTWNNEALKTCTTSYITHYPIEEAGNWVDCVRQKKPVIYNDYKNSPNQKGLPGGHVVITRFMSVPVIENDKVKIIFGVGNKHDNYDDNDTINIQLVANEFQKIIKQHHYDHALKQSEYRLNEAERIANIGCWELDLTKNLLIWSNEIYLIFEINPEQFGASYEAFLDTVHPDDRETVNNAYINSVKGKTPYSIDHRLLFPDNRIKFVHEECQTFYDENGTPLRSIGTVQDITGRKLIDNALKESEQKLRSVFNTVEEALSLNEIIFDDNGEIADYRVLEVNPAFEKDTGLKREFAIGQNATSLFGLTSSYINQFWKEHINDDRPITTDMYIEQTKAWKHIITSKPVNNRFVISYTDISERVAYEKEREANLWFFESMDKINKALQSSYDFEQMMNNVLDELLSVLGCDRAWLVYPCDPSSPTWRVAIEKTKPEYPGALGSPKDFPTDKNAKMIFQTILNSNTPVQFGPGAKNPLPKEVAEQFNEQSQLAMAVVPKVDKPYMFGVHQCSYPRVWTPDEEKFLNEVGRRLTDVLTSILMYRDLSRREKELKDAQRIGSFGNWDWDALTDTITWSEEYYRIYGFDPTQKPPGYEEHLKTYSKESAAKLDEAVKNSMKTGKPYELDLEQIRSDGTKKWITARGECKFDSYGNIIGLRGTAQDITERKMYEQVIARLNRVYKVLSETNQLIVREKDRKHLLKELCRITVEIGELRMAWVGFVDEKTHYVIPETWFGKEDNYLSCVKNSIDDVPEGRSPVGIAIRENRSLFSTDISKQPELLPWRDEALKRGYRSSAAFPITENQKPTGVFVVYADEPAFFTENELSLLKELTMDISYALENLNKEKARKTAEEALAISEKKFRTIFENIQDIFFQTDNDGIITTISPSAERFTGFTPEELIGKPAADVYYNKDDRDLFLQEVRLNGEVIDYEIRYKTKSGGIIYTSMNAHCLYNKAGEMIGIEGLIRDITERKISDMEIKKLYEAVEQSPASIVITDLKGNIEYVNKTFEETTGYTQSEVINQNPRILKSGHMQEEDYRKFWYTISSGKTWRGEFLNKKKNGDLYWEDATITPIRDKDSNITNYLAIKQDITEKKKIMEELILAKERAEKSDKLKTEFLAQMSHEIRSPMNVTLNFMGLIKEELQDKMTPQLEEYFNSADLAGKRLIRTIELILNTAEMQIGSYEPSWSNVDLEKDILFHLIREYSGQAASKGLEFILTSNRINKTVYADSYSIDKIFSNLIDNAIKYTMKGKVEVIIDKDKNENINVAVVDTGIGISEEFIPKLFEPFMQEERGYSRRYEGNGLGLALVKKYCDLNKVSITVESEKGKGSKFLVTFYQQA